MTPPAPTRELGSVVQGQLPGLPTWIVTSGGYDQHEHVPDLQWPLRNDLLLRMSRSTHVAGLSQTVFTPIEGFQFYLDPQNADEQTAEYMAQDYGLPVGEDGVVAPQRTAGRFSLKEHLRLALKAPAVYGHAVFEQIAEVEKGGKRDGWVRLKKLAPRPQRTITEWQVASDGGLVAVVQSDPRDGKLLPIPVDRLTVYVHNQEPGSWVGDPMIRELYEAWFYADLLWRLDAVKHDRNSMGVPVARLKEGASPTGAQEANAQAHMMAVRAGDLAGLVEDENYEFAMQGVSGSTTDPADSAIKHEQRMSRVMLAQLAMMGQTETGSLALSNNMVDLTALGRRKLAQAFCDTFTAHVIEDHLDWQGDPTAPAPRLAFKETDPEEQMQALAVAVEKGLIQVDDEIEAQVRSALNVAPRKTPRSTGPPPGAQGFGNVTAETAGDTTQAPATDSVQAAAATSAAPDAFTRDPTAVEIQAAVDFAGLAERWRKRGEQVGQAVAQLRQTAGVRLAGQVADLVASGDAKGLAKLTAPLVGLEILTTEFHRAVEEGSADHLAEAAAQGADAGTPDLSPAKKAAGERAVQVASSLGGSLLGSVRKAADLANGPAASAGSIAAAASSAAASLAESTVISEVSSGVVSSTGEGRVAAMRAVTADGEVSASELIDSHTCDPCLGIDGKRYATLEDGLADYPSGAQCVYCLGREKCRGLLVVTYNETPADSFAPGDGKPL